MHVRGISLRNPGKLVFQWSETRLSCLAPCNIKPSTVACKILSPPNSSACFLCKTHTDTGIVSHLIDTFWSSIIACNTRLVVSSVKITQITVVINSVLACSCRSNVLFLSLHLGLRREGEAGGHKFQRCLSCRSFYLGALQRRKHIP